MDASSPSEHCSVLVTGLPQDWFQLEEDGKREYLGKENILKISCCDASKRSAVVRARLSGAEAQRIVNPPSTSTVVIENEKVALTLSLKNAQDGKLLESMAHHLNLEVCGPMVNTYTVYGSLDMIADFRLALEKNIMTVHANSPVAALDNDGGAAATGAHSNKNGAAAAAVSHPGSATTSTDTSVGLDKLSDSFRFDVLLMIAAMNKLDGIHINLHDRLVFADQNSKSLFYDLYDSLARQKIFFQIIAFPTHLSIPVLKSDLDILKQKHNMSGFVILEDSSEIGLVSTSSRQFDSFVACVRDLIQSSGLSYQLPGGQVLQLLKRNIVTEEVDIIVNAANDRLEHAGGVAAAINKASGGDVQQYSRQFIKKRHNKSLKVGDIAVTNAGGALKCQKILHAVGPQSQNRDCQNILTRLVHAILNEGERLGYRSIALPAISTGIFGVSKDLVAKCFLSAIPSHRFLASPPVLKDIRIVIIDEATFSCFRGHFENILLRGKVTVPFNRVSSIPEDSYSKNRDPSASSYAATVSSDRSNRENKSRKGHNPDRPDHDHDLSKHRNERSRISPDKSDKKKDSKVHGHGSNVGKDSGNGKTKNTIVDIEEKSGNDGIDDHRALSPGSCGTKEITEITASSGRDDSVFTHPPDKTCNDDLLATGRNDNVDAAIGDATDNANSDKIVSKEVKSRSPDKDYDKKVVVSESPDLSTEEPSPSEFSSSSSGHQPSSLVETGNVTTFSESLPQLVSPTTLPQNFSHPPGIYSKPGNVTSPTPAVTTATNYSALPQPLSMGNHMSFIPESGPPQSHAGTPSFPSSALLCKAQCCACSSTFVSQMKCGHFKCVDCLKIKYLCPVCSPELTRHGTPHNATFAHCVESKSSLPGYPDCGIIIIQFTFPEFIDGDNTYGTNTVYSYLPNNPEGQEVLKLFLKAYGMQPMYSYIQTQGSFQAVILGHSHFKIYCDRGGLWGYPDQSYLERVKEYLQNCLLQGTAI